MAEKRPPIQHEISVEFNGKTHSGKYSVDRGVITVHYMMRHMTTQLGGSPPESVARVLLIELLSEVASFQYESVMRDAKETIFVVAARRGIDTNMIDVEIDAGLGPGAHQQHVLVISVRGAPLSVSDRNIAHEWLPDGTAFIHDRFSTLVATLLSELTAKAEEVGILLSKNK